MRIPIPRRAAVAVTALSLAAGGAACGQSDASQPGEKVELTANLFGNFGYEPLYEEYEKAHPNVKITEHQAEFEDHHKNLTQHLATGAGAADIEAIEVGYMGSFTSQPQRFINLAQHGASSMQADYLDWKWQQGLAKDGSVIGLGTDVGGLAMCYRTDLFEEAGLPKDRDKVSELWPTWEDYIDTGKRFAEKAPRKSKFVDGPGEIFRAIVNQAPMGYYDANDKIIAATNPDVKKAWDLSVRLVQADLSAKLTAYSPPWNTGFAKGTFATIICPAWMTGYIQENAKNASGKWDIAAVPGGSGNSGGSHLTVPKQSKHPKEAADLVKFLISKENQAKVFKETGTFPSMPALYDSPEIKGFTKEFFNNAPVGKIYSEAAKALEPQHLGPKEAEVRAALGDGIGRVEQGKQTPEEAWQRSLKDLERIK